MNVRWDSVVVNSRFWAEPPSPAAARPPSCKEGTEQISVKVWLFGGLASSLDERPVEVKVLERFSVSDVIAELGRRYGDEFLDRVVGPDGRKFKHCRVFVDGFPADNVDAQVHTGSSPALVEMILVTAIEGG